MFNKYSLTFQSVNLELEYRESQIPVVKKQYTAFTLQTCLYMIFQSIYYLKSQPYFLVILLSCSFVIIFLIFSKFLIDKYPSVINIVLPILQLILFLGQSVDYAFRETNSYNPFNSSYDWYYGFCACYFHIAIFIQGYLILSQTFLVIGLLLVYILWSYNSSEVYIGLLLNFICIIVGMIAIKYTIENGKRLQFLHNRERKKWFAIIDTVLQQSIIVIKLDKQQDQLRIHQMNNITKEILQVNNDNDLRTVLRNLTYSRGSKLSGEDNKCSLEKHIRMMLQGNSSAGSAFEISKKGIQDKLINSLICQSNILEYQFKVQLVTYWTDEQQMVIMAAECLNNNQQNHDKLELNLKNRLITSLAKRCISVYFKEKNDRFSQLRCMNYFVCLNILQTPNLLNGIHIKRYSSDQVIKLLKSVFQYQLEIINKLKTQYLSIDLNSVLIIFISLLQFRDKKKEGFIKISSKVNENNIESIHFTLMQSTKQIIPQIRVYFSKPLFFVNNEDISLNYSHLQQNLIHLDKKLNCQDPLTATTLIIIKYLLYHFGCNTQIKTKQKNNLTHFSFSLLNQ
ncbi:unnamed protein product (macronuclear) [Paramecium tetraurelia]|uniref:Transmembrane protein n=1 Tax=Paramecium tetraurelia TaxID=5888 RepID=A0CN57_PARTE|nr:uncharacterized protein GSPATT00008665001 [Paramecium tetraurelia]CAK72224.1 unnamed protein product [Paramecium tetraurelia]|eukprot:XP_001439621.1 hypothetical protein (macronuclear) [Paramecium tetraurelia strain d4-2]